MIAIASDQQRSARLAALADGTRAAIVELLAERPRTTGELAGAFPIAGPAVSRHLRVLREAGLVEEERPADDRRVRLYTLRTAPLTELSGWLEGLSGSWQRQLDAYADYARTRSGRDA